ncbi:glycoside hydrolase [Paenibacillus mesophilus]|uniref:glycoside hydrolase family 25 protein n=1 Tax=Paenibacillus mesophilus TaxID=2582849 RepID=UPI00110E4874|nr:glycoside hydrolase family 25 protein [Paenibacillus mesophilus]TMV49345.1 glycoside hydrolase [Paenibacillus mesophilus]
MQARNEQNIPIIDVSKWQGNIDWLRVASSTIDDRPIRGAYVKSSEGIGYVDPLFRRNAVGAPAAGLAVGFYHYCRPETGNTAAMEAEHFLETVAGLPVTLPYVLDVEGEAADLGASRLTDWCYEWLSIVEQRTGHRCMVYSGGFFARSYLGSKLARWPLWVAHYGVDTPMSNGTWDRWAMHQYSETGRVDGIDGRVDLNEMDLVYWEELTGAPVVEQKTEAVGAMLLEQWQWKMLGDSLDGLYHKGLIGDYTWAEKAYKGEMTQTELVWLNTIVYARQQGIQV